MSTTLVVSDLHLGSRLHMDVVSRPDVRGALLEALAGADRLVLLGDTLELRHGPVHEVLPVAEPVLRDVGQAMAGREIVIVAGNHDHLLVAPWLARRREAGWPPPLGLEEEVDHRPGELLARVVEWLAPAHVRIAHPGVWLRDDVWATHGHYQDVHFTVPTFERLGAGLMTRLFDARPPERATPDDYEQIVAPLYAWAHEVAQHSRPRRGAGASRSSARAWRILAGESSHRPLRSWALRTGFGLTLATLNRAGLGPLRADVSGPELRRASLRAVGEVARRLGVDAAHVIYGHSHRAGPLPGDDRAEWVTATGTRLWNSGTWVYEDQFLTDVPGQSPYWPGAAVRLGESGDPEVLRFLTDRARAELKPPRA